MNKTEIRRMSVVFDDACPMCVTQMRWLRRLDWLGALDLVPMSSAEAAIRLPGVPREALREAMHCLTPRGKVYRGARAVRAIAPRVPLLLPLAIVLWIPGMIQVADWLYTRVARNRYVLSRVFGCADACKLPAGAEGFRSAWQASENSEASSRAGTGEPPSGRDASHVDMDGGAAPSEPSARPRCR